MRTAVIAAATLVLASCDASRDKASDAGPEAQTKETSDAGKDAPNDAATAPAPAPAPSSAPAAWKLQSSGEGAALALVRADGGTAIRLFCPAGKRRLLVNVPTFRPIGSEERLSIGSGGVAVALVADSRGDTLRGGVSGSGDVPEDVAAIVSGDLTASYGTQRSGPHPRPARGIAAGFARACSESKSAGSSAATAVASACFMQGAEKLQVPALRAVGTEPFWAARIEGRCVTYSHPDDQKGTRVWTSYTEGTEGRDWSGALRGKPFHLRAREEVGCSDGMSDKSYPIAVQLTVNGEERSGCAEPM